MKRTLMSAMLLLATLSLSAQQKTWEHQVYAAAGLMISRADGANTTGVSMKLGYSLSRYLSENFSLTGGVAIRQDVENLFSSADGADDDSFVFLDVPIAARYHVADGTGHWVLGLGPVFSFCVDNDTYYINADPNSPIDGRRKIKPFHLGLQPSVHYQPGRFSIGVDATIGLLNAKERHGLTTGSRHLHNIMATVGYRF